jgi:protein phosphatase 1L
MSKGSSEDRSTYLLYLMEIQTQEATAWAGGGESRRLPVTFGYARVKGLRDHPIEDYHVARMQSFETNEIGLFAVYDGHAGTEVAAYLEQKLFDSILVHPDFAKDPKKSIIDVYLSTDERLATSSLYVALFAYCPN